ncbi:aspartate dehydrogenase [Xylophilus sp.]|uniref:aspartate dehydrogenase n=1 Tax=Xylophilus sp. TaxID=2653893 RepID=UPI0013B8AAD4|nr:aspartate dehydrogenase [Xylophilus sp.]KAF1042064.1 MAG: L-aspartate dehydrogenase [Xylophilus sp.]
MTNKAEIQVAVAGLGAIGKVLATQLDAGRIGGCRLAAISGRDPDRTAAFVAGLSTPVSVVPLAALPERAAVIVECAPSALLSQVVEPALKAGRKVVVLSVGALLERPALLELARAGQGQILVPSGALLGLDAVTAAAEGRIESVRMVSRKPPGGFKGAPFVEQNDIDLDHLSEPLQLYAGSARGAAKGFPANLNVSVALALAGIGPDRTQIEVWADPGVVRNTHHIEVVSDAALLHMTIENIPSENPKTGRITAQSVIALLRKLSAPVRIGT